MEEDNILNEDVRIIWRPEDIEYLRPNWSLERCAQWLFDHGRIISDRSVEAGWAVIELLLDMEGKSSCTYCGGSCPSEPADSKHLCDGYAGDIDGLVANGGADDN